MLFVIVHCIQLGRVRRIFSVSDDSILVTNPIDSSDLFRDFLNYLPTALREKFDELLLTLPQPAAFETIHAKLPEIPSIIPTNTYPDIDLSLTKYS